MGRLLALTAYSQNGQKFAKPRVVYVNEEFIKVTPAGVTGKLTRVLEENTNTGNKDTYKVYERALHIEIARNPTATDLYLKKFVQAAIAGVGTTQGAGAVISPLTYLAEALTIGAGATEAFVLPAAVVGRVVVVLSNDAAGDAAKIFPASGEYINDQAVNTVYSMAAGTRAHFVCLATGKWTVADDFGTNG